MKNKNKKIIIILVSLASIFVILYVIYKLCMSYYKPMEFQYEGRALGQQYGLEMDTTEEGYVYNGWTGYFSVEKVEEREWDSYLELFEWHDFDFQPELAEDEEYVCTYGYRLETLEYSRRKKTKMSKGYYNRATLSTDDFQENVYYFYKIKAADSIHLGGMNEDDERTEYEYYR